MLHLPRRLLALFLVASCALVLLPPPALPRSVCCPFCVEQKGPTLMGDFNQAGMVLVGTFTNAKADPNGALDGTTDFVIEQVLKSHPAIKGKKMITLPKNIPSTKSKFVLFCDEYKGTIDPYRGVEVPPKSDLIAYLKGAVAFKDRPIGERLRYCFDFLQSPELEVSLDAYREFQKASYEDYRDLAKSLPADTIAGWLQDAKTSPYRYGLYASLLGHCGNGKHAAVLRAMIDDPEKRKSSGIDGMLAGYIMLLHKDGHTKDARVFMNGVLRDAKQDFLMRYATLRTARFFWDTRTDIFGKKDLADSVAILLNQPDMADFSVEDLGKWGRWEMTDRVLALFDKPSHNAPVIKRAILRFALRCPLPQAADFVRRQRARDAEWVNDTEELLRMEAPTPKKGPGKTNGKK